MSSDKTTVSKLHDDKIKEISIAESRLPILKTELEELENQMDDKSIGIIQRKNNVIRIRQIKKDIEEITSKRMIYYMDCGYLLNKYMEIDKKNNRSRSGLDALGKKEFNPDSNKKNIIYRSIRSIVDPDFAYVDEDTVNDENYCYECKCFRVTVNDEALMVCPKCSSQITLTQKYTKPSINDPPSENKVYEYQRFTHFCNWIDKIQGKESLNIPEYVIDAIKKEIVRERKEDQMDKLTERDVRRYLKKYKSKKQKKYDSFYDHSTKILWMVTGIKPLQMTPEMEANLQNMFMAIQEPFEMNKNDRHNFSSYAYILYKFCQLLGYNEFLPKFRLHKNEGLIYRHDSIWKKICEYMGGEENGWIFIKTYLY